MSRLFYEERDELPRLNFEVDDSNHGKSYFEKVAKLVPTEIIAGYIALINLVPLIQLQITKEWVYLIIFFLCLILTPIYLNSFAIKGKSKKIHLVVSSFGFIFWAYSISGSVVLPSIYDSALSSIFLIAFSLISGIIPLKK